MISKIFSFFALTIFVLQGTAQTRTLKVEEDGFKWYEIKRDNYVGVQDFSGKIIIPLSRHYNYVTPYRVVYQKSPVLLWEVKKDGVGTGLLNRSGKEIISPKRGYSFCTFFPPLDTIPDNAPCCIPFTINDIDGVCDTNGKEIISRKLHQGYEYHGLAYDREHPDEERFGFVDDKPEEDINCVGALYDVNGKEVISAKKGYNPNTFYIGRSRNGWSCITASKQYDHSKEEYPYFKSFSIFDLNGNLVLPTIYEDIELDKDGYIQIAKNEYGEDCFSVKKNKNSDEWEKIPCSRVSQKTKFCFKATKRYSIENLR